MTDKQNIKKALIVLSPELINPDKPLESTLLRRAVALAKKTGCEIELFHVCYDGSLENQLFTSEADLTQQRKIRSDRAALEVAGIAAYLRTECGNVKHEVRWDSPRTDAILRKIATSRPDIVMKQGREHTYLFGISSNTDWDLARRSPAHVWFVNDKVDVIDKIVAAVGNKLGEPEDVTTVTDLNLLRTAEVIGGSFEAEVFPVNAYVVPAAGVEAMHLGGTVAPVRDAEEQQKAREQIVQRHKEAVGGLAQFAGVPRKNVRIQEGHPNEVIPEIVAEIGADMVVLGARNISRLERLIKNVTIEPVIAESDSDILVVREHDLTTVPVAKGKQHPGIPQYDLEHAITNPQDAFDSPRELVKTSAISMGLRRRILQVWEYDIRAEMVAENEGGRVGDVHVELLSQIERAKDSLARKEASRAEQEPEKWYLTA